MTGYALLKLGHQVAAMWLIGGVAAREIVRGQARRSQEISRLALLLDAAIRIDRIMVIPGNVAVLALGVPLAILGGWSPFGFLQGGDANWLLVANLILIGGFFLVALIYIPHSRLLASRVASASEAGEITTELRDLLGSAMQRLAHRAEYVGLAAIVALMVLKPF
jgi:uncharacterized membrane protein